MTQDNVSQQVAEAHPAASPSTGLKQSAITTSADFGVLAADQIIADSRENNQESVPVSDSTEDTFVGNLDGSFDAVSESTEAGEDILETMADGVGAFFEGVLNAL